MRPALPADARVLVQLPRWLGDVVMAEPLITALVEHLAPAGALLLHGPPRLAQWLERSLPVVDRRALERGHALQGTEPGRAVRVEGGALQAQGPGEHAADWAILLDGSLRSAWRVRVQRTTYRVGWTSGGRGLLLTHGVRPPREVGRGTRGGIQASGALRRRLFGSPLPRPFGAACRELAAAMELGPPPREPRLEVAGQPAREGLRQLGLVEQPFVLLQAGRRQESAKALAPEEWLPVAEDLSRSTGWDVVLVHGPGEQSPDLARGVDGSSPPAESSVRPKLHLWPGEPPTLDQLLDLCAQSALFVGPDTGPRHLAAAVGTPAVCAFGPTEPRHTAETGNPAGWLVDAPACAPCYLERCPLQGAEHRACLRRIEPGAFSAAAQAVLAGR